MEELFEKSHRRRQMEPNVVPILDMLTTVIFFLLMSTSFIEYTKLSLPPSGVEAVTDPLQPAPLSPRLYATVEDGEFRAVLTWTGETPGILSRGLKLDPELKPEAQVRDFVSDLLKRFKEKFPQESTLQVGLAGGAAYQNLISVMDGSREHLPEVVLLSQDDAEPWLGRYSDYLGGKL